MTKLLVTKLKWIGTPFNPRKAGFDRPLPGQGSRDDTGSGRGRWWIIRKA